MSFRLSGFLSPPKIASKLVTYSKLPLDVNKCVNVCEEDGMQWICIPSRACSRNTPSIPGIGFKTTNKDKAVTPYNWMKNE